MTLRLIGDQSVWFTVRPNRYVDTSLCVIVNPGATVKDRDPDHELRQDDPISCMLILDSLQASGKNDVANSIREWLNLELRVNDEAATESKNTAEQ